MFTIDIIDKAAVDIDMSFNTKKTVCMIFNPHVKHKVISGIFPQFHLAGCKLSFVPNFDHRPDHDSAPLCTLRYEGKDCLLQVCCATA